MLLLKSLWMLRDGDDSAIFSFAYWLLDHLSEKKCTEIATNGTNLELAEKATELIGDKENLIYVANNAKLPYIRVKAAQKSDNYELVLELYEKETDIHAKILAAGCLRETKYLPEICALLRAEGLKRYEYESLLQNIKWLSAKEEDEKYFALIENVASMDDITKLKRLLYEDQKIKITFERKMKLFDAVCKRIADIDEKALLEIILDKKSDVSVIEHAISNMKSIELLEEITREENGASKDTVIKADKRIHRIDSDRLCPNDRHDFKFKKSYTDMYGDEVEIHYDEYVCTKCGLIYTDENWHNGIHDRHYSW